MNCTKATLLLLSISWTASTHADINAYVNRIKSKPAALYTFFKKMPKGGELHYHLAGGPSAEVMLSLVAQADYCVARDSLTVSETTNNCQGVSTNSLVKDPLLYKRIIQSWSMEDFTPGKESGHDHFFNSFMKFMSIVINYRPQLIANVIERAAEQNEHYLEIMDIADNANATSFGPLIKNAATFAERKNLLLNNKDFQKNIIRTIQNSEAMEEQARKYLGCERHSQQKSCQIKVKFLYYVLREQAPDSFFAQALNAFEAVARSKGNLVGVNLVQPEDGVISLRDYEQQMRIFNYLHAQYPQVHIALHAGEITADLVNKKELSYHIHDAVFIGKAQRIGHGVDILSEDNAQSTLAYMAKHQIPVEVNLTSNASILNVSGSKHPLKYYLKHHVPVVFSTDDEGILRTDLTQQYVNAVMDQHLDYSTIKQINRNALTYAFIPGQSIWANPYKAELVPACQNLNALSCMQFIEKNEKAQLQWDLEKKLAAFEKAYS
ncbi:adenosine deaminase [Legionella sp. km772]|uniref:adenosine deaminase family protein n=1 Tax=Legionella sp. km772 TaxID=2498111 RepID=UPI000F8CAF85|nr:adenosine deaminase [Legionella sp. km772]RUR06255.1 adenosine deaminase [Legionella sp. km772]